MDNTIMVEFNDLVNTHVSEFNDVADRLTFGSVRHIRFSYIAMGIEEAAKKVETKYQALPADITNTDAYNILVNPIDELKESARAYLQQIENEPESHSVNATIHGYNLTRTFLRKAFFGRA